MESKRFLRDRKPPLDPRLYTLAGDSLAFFQEQTGIQDEEELKKHIIDVQKRAYDIYGYPCIRRFGFLYMKITRNPAYVEVLKLVEVRKNPVLLDIGCCFGNDIRKAVADGWPIQSAIASDLRKGFWQSGHELFKTTPETYPLAFIEGNALNSDFLSPITLHALKDDIAIPSVDLHKISCLNDLHQKVSAIHASSLFHLFQEEVQLDLARRLASLLLPKKGSVIFGTHISTPEKGLRPQITPKSSDDDWRMFCHNPESWEQLWRSEVFSGSGIDIKVDTCLVSVERKDLEELARKEDGEELKFWVMQWSVTIV
ncbi:hypothetical protein BJ165DRAFT_1041597 [Panaeolus papilionaceus]|nr:hypothetical protein BJ165DRAFT_1041597 [Panaeolus papilionaceus]